MPPLRSAFVFSGAVLLAACATSGRDQPAPDVAAADRTASAEATSQGEALDGDRVVCKEIRKTGTRFGTRHCLTAAQWEAIARGSQEGVSEIQRRASHQQDMPGQGN